MFGRAWEYVVAVLKWYKGHISGWMLAIVAIGLDIAAAFFATDPSKSVLVIRVSAALTTLAAIWAFQVAQYDAWRDERTARRKADAELNADADIKGTIWFVLTGVNPYENPQPTIPTLRPVPQPGPSKVGSEIYISCDECANHGTKPCQISELRLYLSSPEVQGEPFKYRVNLNAEATEPRRRVLNVSGKFPIPDVTTAQLEASAINVYLADSVGKEYRNTNTSRSTKPLGVVGH